MNDSKRLTVLWFPRDKLAPSVVGNTSDGEPGGCDGMLILSPTQQGYSSQAQRVGDRGVHSGAQNRTAPVS
jgi:hypothetical protein